MSGTRDVPDNITLQPLPPLPAELNPSRMIEKLRAIDSRAILDRAGL